MSNRLNCGKGSFNFEENKTQTLVLHNPSLVTREYFSFLAPYSRYRLVADAWDATEEDGMNFLRISPQQVESVCFAEN